MAFDIGFDVRNTLAFVTDPAGCFFVNVGMNYPDSSDFGGVTTAGWNSGLNNGSFSDVSNSVDPRLAGRAFVTNGFSSYMQFQVDLPAAGQYSVVCALGSATGGGWTQYLMLTDGASGGTLFASQSNVAVSAGFMDASGNIWPTSTFFANQVPVVHTFTSTSLLVSVGQTGGAGFASLAHIRVTAAASFTPDEDLAPKQPRWATDNPVSVFSKGGREKLRAERKFKRRGRLYVPEYGVRACR